MMFPPNDLSDLSSHGVAAILALRQAIKTHRSTIVVGAGVSASADLPPWDRLLHTIATVYFAHWDFIANSRRSGPAKPPRNISMDFWRAPASAPAAARTAATNFRGNGDPLQTAQMIKGQLAPRHWQHLVRRSLYVKASPPQPSPLLRSIASLCARLRQSLSVLSYNYDNAVEIALQAHQVPYNPIWSEECGEKPQSISIYYPHGYMKFGGGPVSDVVLAEEDYNSYAVEPYAWRNTVQLRQFTNTVCIFVGFSLTDPHVRRLLWVAQRAHRVWHYAFLPAPEDTTDARRFALLFDGQLARLNVRAIRYPLRQSGDTYGRLPELLDGLLDGAGSAVVSGS